MTTLSHLEPATMASHCDAVRKYFAAFGCGDIPAALALMTEDVVWHIDGVPSVSTVGILYGRAQVREWLESFPVNFKPQTFTVDRLFESGDSVLALGRFRHTVLSTGHTIGSDYVVRFEMKNGLISRYQIFEDSALLARAFDPEDSFERHQIRINGNVYAYSDIGSGPAIIFAHGLFLDRTSFEQQVKALSKNHRCIVLDMPGHGESSVFPSVWSLEDAANDIALMVTELALGKVTFIGQSQGGMIGIRIAAQFPKLISQLVIIGASARAEYAERLGEWDKLRETLRNGNRAERELAFSLIQQRLCPEQWLNENHELVKREIAIMLAHDTVGIVRALSAATLNRVDIRHLLPQINVPVLVVCGDLDRATPVELSQEMAEKIPLADLCILKGVGHHPQLEASAELLSAIECFLLRAA